LNFVIIQMHICRNPRTYVQPTRRVVKESNNQGSFHWFLLLFSLTFTSLFTDSHFSFLWLSLLFSLTFTSIFTDFHFNFHWLSLQFSLTFTSLFADFHFTFNWPSLLFDCEYWRAVFSLKILPSSLQQNRKLRFDGISRYKFRQHSWSKLNLHLGILSFPLWGIFWGGGFVVHVSQWMSRMRACMNACMYECVHVWMCACMNVCMYECVHVWMCACMNVCMYECVHVW